MRLKEIVQIILMTGILSFLLFVKGTSAQGLPKYQLSPAQVNDLVLTPGILKALALNDDDHLKTRGFAIDLNNDGFNDYILMSDPNLCGTGGCPFEIINGKTEKMIGQVFGSPVFVFDQKINSFAVLHSYSHSSAQSGTYACYVFDGASYVPVSAVYLMETSVDELFNKYKDVPRYINSQAPRYHVTQGQEFSVPIGNELTLSLVPNDNGWYVHIQPTNYSTQNFPDGPPNFAAVTAPFHGPNATDIQGWHFRNSDNSGPNEPGLKNVNAPGTERVIEYCETEGDFIHWQEEYEKWRTGLCLQSKNGCFPSPGCHKNVTLKIYDLQLTNLIIGKQAQIAAMEFSITKQ